MTTLLAALAALLLLLMPARAQPPAMRPVPLGAKLQGYDAMTVLDGMRAAKALAYLNAVPPESSDVWTMIVIAFREDGSGAILAGHQGRVCAGAILTPDLWEEFPRALNEVAA